MTSYIERELQRIGQALRAEPNGEKYGELYAAQQALAWALDPNNYRAPTDAITGEPVQASTAGTPGG